MSTLIDSSLKVKEIFKVKSSDLNDSVNKFLFVDNFEYQLLLKDSKAIKKPQDVSQDLNRHNLNQQQHQGLVLSDSFQMALCFQIRGGY